MRYNQAHMMSTKVRITLLALALALYAPALMADRPEWPMPRVRAALPGSGEPLYRETFINPAREGTISHVASLAPLEGGGMIAAWYSGSREGARDVSIYLSGLNPDTGLWGTPRKVMDRHSASRDLGRRVKKVGNAMLHSGQNGKLWMFYSHIAAGGWSMSRISYTSSLDGGLTWERSKPLHLGPALNLTNNVKNKPVTLSDGTFLIPAYHELARKFSEAVRFDPDTETYEKRRMSNFYRAIQPAIVTGADGGLTAIFRNMSKNSGGNKKRFAYISRSRDGGASWTPLEGSGLLNPDSGLDAIGLSDGRMLAAANDTEKGRHRLSLLVSNDGGMSWERVFIVEEGEPGSEFSYPFMARDSEGNIHLAYTYKRERIKHVKFNEAWLDWIYRSNNMQKKDGGV